MFGIKILRALLFFIVAVLIPPILLIDFIVNLLRSIALSITAPDGLWFIIGYMQGYYKTLIPRIDDILYRIRTGSRS